MENAKSVLLSLTYCFKLKLINNIKQHDLVTLITTTDYDF